MDVVREYIKWKEVWSVSKRKIGVLVMSYGTPRSMEEVEAYYTHIRRGNPPTPEQLNDLIRRYEAIGGIFPLRENTNKQVEALEQHLNQQAPDDLEFVCFQGLKHAQPLIEEGVQAMKKAGIEEGVGIVLAPHYSVMSVGEYIKRAQAEAEKQGIDMRFVESYHLHPALIEAFAERVKESLLRFPEEVRDQVRIIFTAHSLPKKIVQMNDPYVEQLMATSKTVMYTSKLINPWQFAWQSAGQTPIPWLGPDILEVIKELHEQEQVNHILVAPVGFVSDHLEILYDLDIEAQSVAKELGIHLERIPSLNVDPRYIQTLTESVLTQLERN